MNMAVRTPDPKKLIKGATGDWDFGIVLRAAPSVVQRAEGEDEQHARRRAIDEQRQQLAYVIHHVQRAQ